VFDQVVIKTSGVEDVYFLVMNTQLVPGQHLKHLIKGSKTSRQNNACNAHLIHGSFSFMHVFCDDQSGEAFMLMLPGQQHCRDYTGNTGTMGKCTVGKVSHDAFFGATIYNVKASTCKFNGQCGSI